MHKNISYRILIAGLRLGLGFMVSTGVARAQQNAPTAPTQADLYCSGVVTDKPVPNDSYVISGEDSRYKSTFSTSDYIFINRGGGQGVKVGDEFEVVRPVRDMMATTVWFKYQTMLSHAMGTRYADIVRPFEARPAPQFHDMKLDPFAAPSGKKTAMVVSSKDFAVLTGPGRIVYVNLGSAQGLRVGDYFRMFRYQGTHIETNYQLQNTAYKVYGYGSTPVAYEWNNLPRQVLGEGIVLRIGPNSSTVMLTTVREEIFAGDYVEVE